MGRGGWLKMGIFNCNNVKLKLKVAPTQEKSLDCVGRGSA